MKLRSQGSRFYSGWSKTVSDFEQKMSFDRTITMFYLRVDLRRIGQTWGLIKAFALIHEKNSELEAR